MLSLQQTNKHIRNSKIFLTEIIFYLQEITERSTARIYRTKPSKNLPIEAEREFTERNSKSLPNVVLVVLFINMSSLNAVIALLSVGNVVVAVIDGRDIRFSYHVSNFQSRCDWQKGRSYKPPPICDLNCATCSGLLVTTLTYRKGKVPVLPSLS